MPFEKKKKIRKKSKKKENIVCQIVTLLNAFIYIIFVNMKPKKKKNNF